MDAYTGTTTASAARCEAPVLLWLRTFSGKRDQVREVRHWLESILPGCDPRDALTLVASEFCANAVEHTRSGAPGGQFTVHLAWSPAAARLTVEDEGSSLPPEAVTAALDSEHGRGLYMVDAIAADWGFADTGKGRLLWADQPWGGHGGPSRIGLGGALPTAEAVRRLYRACPGIQVGYHGGPAAWRALPPGGTCPDDLLTAPCFGALAQMATGGLPVSQSRTSPWLTHTVATSVNVAEFPARYGAEELTGKGDSTLKRHRDLLRELWSLHDAAESPLSGDRPGTSAARPGRVPQRVPVLRRSVAARGEDHDLSSGRRGAR